MAEEPEHPLDRARTFTRLMDNALAIPGTRFKVGLDPLLGLVPGLGDATGAALAGYLVILAARLGAPASVIVRMVGNVALDAAVGAIPFLGDVYDFFWKSNRRNMDLLERFVEQPGRTARSSTAVVVGAVATLVALFGGSLALAMLALRALLSALS